MPFSDRKTDRTESSRRRVFAGILGLLLLAAVLLAAFYPAAEAGHDCAGEDCPVCACVQQCERLLHELGGGTAAGSALVLPVVFLLLPVLFFIREIAEETPVSRKIRLNN